MPDPTFPSLHIRPRRGWVNDPNGVCRIEGTYHVFFQYNPDAPIHEAICWGHASSPDLLRWREEPVALMPRPGTIDAGGCWSGCVTDDSGVPTALYTANPDHSWNATTAVARGDRQLRTWRQPEVPVVGRSPEPGFEMRDPFLFSFGGHRYAVQGAGDRTGHPQIRVYLCDDLDRWTDLGPLLADDDPVARELAPANIWECPNLFRLGEQWVLLVSLWRRIDAGHLLAGVRYLVGELIRTPQGPRFSTRSGGPVDLGDAFYAPQVLVEPDRVLQWGWSWEIGRTRDQLIESGWAGLLTFPREAYADGLVLGWRPAAELTGLRAGRLPWVRGRPFDEAAFEIDTGSAWALRLEGGPSRFRCGGEGPARVLVDGSIVEVFDGPIPRTTRAYPGSGSRWVLDAEPDRTTVHRLGL